MSTEPARVPPMEIKVDEGKWFINKNRLPPRPQTEARQRAIQKQVELYKKLHVIEESNASVITAKFTWYQSLIQTNGGSA